MKIVEVTLTVPEWVASWQTLLSAFLVVSYGVGFFRTRKAFKQVRETYAAQPYSNECQRKAEAELEVQRRLAGLRFLFSPVYEPVALVSRIASRIAVGKPVELPNKA